ncbi:MAG TPA: hypothetical protein VI362_07745 [Ignavibacteriaceae bacterium]|nr:hypothetical protein [Ignavibacteriaceae bacterium]
MKTTEKYIVTDSVIQNGEISLKNKFSSASEIINNLKAAYSKRYQLFSYISCDIGKLSNISLQNYINYKSSYTFEKTIPRSPPSFCKSAKYCS